MEDVMTDAEVQAFGDKLKTFGDQLTPKEQVLLAEIVMRAAAFDSDVEGHGIALPRMSRPAWREVRQQVSGVVRQIAADYQRGASYTSLERPYIHHES